MLALLSLRAGCVDRTIRESLTLLQTSRDINAVHSASLLVLIPSRAGDVSADDSLNGKDLQLAHLHAAVLQDWAQGLRDLGREVESEEVGA